MKAYQFLGLLFVLMGAVSLGLAIGALVMNGSTPAPTTTATSPPPPPPPAPAPVNVTSINAAPPIITTIVVNNPVPSGGSGGQVADTGFSPTFMTNGNINAALTVMANWTIDRKIGEMMQVLFDSTQVGTPIDVAGYNPASIAAMQYYMIGNSGLQFNALASQKSTRNAIRSAVNLLRTQIGTAQSQNMLFAVDNVHGASKGVETPLFPHNINVAAIQTWNASTIEAYGYQMGIATANLTIEMGFNQVFGPNCDVSQDLRWGRNYESLGRDPIKTRAFARGFVRGVQQLSSSNKLLGALTTAKHWIGYGNTDRGITNAPILLGPYNGETLSNFYENNIPPFAGAFDSDTGAMMVSYNQLSFAEDPYSSIRPRRLFTSTAPDIISYPRTTYGFDGFSVSDLDANFISHTVVSFGIGIFYPDGTINTEWSALAGARMIQSGVDMLLMSESQLIDHPNPALTSFANMSAMIKLHVPRWRIDEAVLRILCVKIAMGLYNPKIPDPRQAIVPPPVNAQPNLQAQTRLGFDVAYASMSHSYFQVGNPFGQSLEVDLPRRIIQPGQTVLLLGREADSSGYQWWNAYWDDLGIQCGGWTNIWQGMSGNRTRTTLANLPGLNVNDLWSVLRNTTFTYSDGRTLAGASTIKEGLVRNGFNPVVMTNATVLNNATQVALVIIGEIPYAEYAGDVENNSPGLYLESFGVPGPWFYDILNPVGPVDYNAGAVSRAQVTYLPSNLTRESNVTRLSRATYENLKLAFGAGVPIITVLMTGRVVNIDVPMFAADPVNPSFGALTLRQVSTVVVNAELPCTTGGDAIADYLTDLHTISDGQQFPYGEFVHVNSMP